MHTRSVFAGALFLASLQAGAQTTTSAFTYTTYVAIGDSLTAGYSSDSLVETHQANSYPLLLARQAGVIGTFQQPIISAPGIPAELTLVSLSGPTIVPRSATLGTPKNLGLARPYNNLAVPGASVGDASQDRGSLNALSQIILRGQGTQIEQAVALKPTFITLWIGNNDALGAALRGRAVEGLTLTAKAQFRKTYTDVVAGLSSTGAKIVAANLPDVTTIPFVTTIPPYLVDPSSRQPVLVSGQRVALIGPNGPLAPSTFVTLAAASLLAQGIGVPTAVGGRGTPLPDEVILDAGEVAIIQDYIAADNQAIREVCAAAHIPVMDANTLLGEIKSGTRKVGGISITSEFLTGGFFSYDGVHPTDLGYAVIANEWINTINANGGSLQPVDLLPYLKLNAAASVSTQSEPGNPVFSREAWEQLQAVFPPVR
jgi:lysophospholipase L1-like esterase